MSTPDPESDEVEGKAVIAKGTKDATLTRPVGVDCESKSLTIAGQRVFTGDRKDAVAKIHALSNRPDPQLVITANVDQTINLTTMPGLVAAYRNAAMVTADGAPIVALSKLLGTRTLKRVTGADLLPGICQSELFNGSRIVLTGGSDENLAKAVYRLQETCPNVEIVGVPFPNTQDVGDQSCGDVARSIASLKPQVVFICVGSPKQEEWFMRWQSILPGAAYIGAGAAVDFAAGSMQRAPRLLQVCGLEWAYRLTREPKRLFHRYIVKGPKILPIFAAAGLKRAENKPGE